MELEPIWTCPAIQPLSDAEWETAVRLYAEISSEMSASADPVATAGLELRAALLLLQEDEGFEPADNEFWRGKCRALFLRPAMEPIAHTYWARLRTLDVDPSVAQRAASAMAGEPLVYRTGPSVGRSIKGDVHFPPLEDGGKWLEKIAGAARRPELATALPAYCFAQTIMAHPFSDGNGRFARLMVHAALAHCAGLAGPAIALAPAFYRRARTLGSALTALSEHGDWTDFNRAFFSVLADAMAVTRSLRSRPSG